MDIWVHMKVLIAKKYVSMTKCFVKNKPKTTYKIIDLGKDNFKNYLNTLKKIIEGWMVVSQGLFLLEYTLWCGKH